MTQKQQEEDSNDNNNNHYIDNQKFSMAVHEYNVRRAEAEAQGKSIPKIDDYIGECFIKIAEGMAKRHMFSRYTWKDEMIADGIEYCIRYIGNYDIEKATRTQSPNAFYYFSQIVYFAFVRRIKRENKQSEIKNMLIEKSNGTTDFISNDQTDGNISNSFDNTEALHVSNSYVENMIEERLNENGQ